MQYDSFVKNEKILNAIKNNLNAIFQTEFFSSSMVHWVFIVSIILNLINWGAIAFFIRPVDFSIILHYNVYFGVDMIGFWWQAYFLPLIGILILFINGILGYFFYERKERIITHLLMLSIFFVQIGITISVASVLIINY